MFLGRLAMREHLTFLLAAPMASFGSYAGHERRGSELVPLRSAVLGLVGAAIGIDRSDADGQSDLRRYSVAVQSFQSSVPTRDYHTVQTVPTSKARRPNSRRSALERAGRDVNTIITIRDYRCDVLIGAALWGDGQWSLNRIADCLRNPKFPLYLGRKSCPLAGPLNPVVANALGPAEALSSIEVPECLRFRGWSDQHRARHFVHSDSLEDGTLPRSTELVPGEPLDRQLWTFGECAVWQLLPMPSENAGGSDT